MTLLFADEPRIGTLQPRDYQAEDLDHSFELWDTGTIGTLTRAATGLGKTYMTCMKFDRWLKRGPNYRCMALSYEQELVWQFAEEVADVLGSSISIGVEMGSAEISPTDIPQVVVASRQSLMTHELATIEQREELQQHGLREIGLLTKAAAKSAIGALRKGVDLQLVADGIVEFNESYRCNPELGRYSRLYKFDYRYNWLVCFDEAHKYAMKMKTVGHIVEWFDQNPLSRRSGVTATPKRRDKVSIGSTLFPGISIDYPLTRAIKEGYAVPYLQKFIQVESVDFKRLKEVCKSQEQWDQELDRLLNTEQALAAVCEPMLDLVGDRKTLIFSPSVAMAENVADYINARSECECPSCATRRWYPNLLLGDGAKCRECGDFITTPNVTKGGIQAFSLNGTIPHKARRDVYARHKSGEYQFLSICGLCREGYNDPDISCVAIFRPVSRAASSLAEQMKGRGSRVERGCVNGLNLIEERLAAIAASGKQNCLVVDLVGVTGLADCASTIQIYAEGLPDAIVARAEEIALEGGVDDPQAAIDQAKREDEEARERARLAREEDARRRREEAERRARLDADVKYSTHDVGTAAPGLRAPGMATEGQLKFLHMLGMDFINWQPSKRQAGRMISQLNEEKKSPTEVAYLNGIAEENWKRSGPTVKQAKALARYGINSQGMTPRQVSQEFERIKSGKPRLSDLERFLSEKIESADTAAALNDVACEVRDRFRARLIQRDEYDRLIEAGQKQRTKVF